MLGAALAAACDDPAVLARIGGPLGAEARRAAHQLAALPVEARRTRRASAMAAVTGPVPLGIRGVDPSWLEAGLSGLPAHARDALASARSDRVSTWLARWASSAVPPMPSIDAALGAPQSIGDAVRLGAAAVHGWLEDVGADQLAFALGARVHAAAGGLDAVVARAARRIAEAPRVGQLGARRRAIACARIEPGPRALAIVGARAIAPHLDALVARQLACRLALEFGRAVEDAIAAHLRDPVTDAPTWQALGAAGSGHGSVDDR